MQYLTLRFAWNQLVRDIRSGELWMIVGAVVLAVASLTTVGFFSDRMATGLKRDAAQLMGGDAVVVSDQPLPESFIQQAQSQGLLTTQMTVFPSMARGNDLEQGPTRLVSLKAVGLGYPLRGQVQLVAGDGALPTPSQGPPGKGSAWVDRALLDALGIKIGDTLWLGNSQFRISHQIVSEPDKGSGFSNFAPRVMVHRDDVAATGLIQPASRVSYRLAVAAADSTGASYQRLSAFTEWVQTTLAAKDSAATKGIRLDSLEGGNPEMTQTMKRASGFLGLVTLLAALISAVALAVAARNFSARRLSACAMLRVLGLSQRGIVALYGFELLAVALAASLVGAALGYGVQMALVAAVQDLLTQSLAVPSWRPVGLGIGVGVTLVLCFGLAPVLQLARVAPLSVMRRDLGQPKVSTFVSIFSGVVGFSFLLILASDNLVLSGVVLLGFVGAGLLFVGLAYAGILGLKRLLSQRYLPAWARVAYRQLTAKPLATSLQVASLSFGLLAMLLLVLLRTDLVQQWRQSGSAKAPDRFVINVLPEQAQDFQQAMAQGHAQVLDWYPMFRGRLIQINGKAVGPDQFDDDRAKRLVDREFNLSNSDVLPSHNQLVGGNWQSGEKDAISMEEGIAKTLGVQLGDTLTFDIGGMPSQVKVTSLRRVDWGSMRANFFALYPQQQLQDFPQTLMATYRVPQDSRLDSVLVQRFPNITIVDMRQTIDQLQKVLDKVVLAVELLFAFSLMAGVLVVATSLSGTRADRLHELSVMRAMGASQKLLAQVQRTELALVGAFAGLMASCVANTLAFGLSRFVFEMPWSFSALSLLLGVVAGALLALSAGAMALRGIANRPVIQSLRNSYS